MQIEEFRGVPFHGVYFDGSFETALDITQHIRAQMAGNDKVRGWRMEHTGSSHRLVISVSTNMAQRDLCFEWGDCLVINGNGYDIIKADVLYKFFTDPTGQRWATRKYLER